MGVGLSRFAYAPLLPAMVEAEWLSAGATGVLGAANLAGYLEDTSEAEIRAMIEVDLLAPILLTRDALPDLRRSGEGMVVNVASGIALIDMPFYATYAAARAGLARFGEAMRRELKGEGVHLLTAYPGTRTPR